MWTKEQIRTLMSTKKFAVVAASAVSLVAGGAGGYLLAQKTLQEKYAEISKEEIEEAKVYYSKLHKTEEYADPARLAEEAGLLTDSEERQDAEEALQKYQGQVEVKPELLEYSSYPYPEGAALKAYQEAKDELEHNAEKREEVIKNVFRDSEPAVAFDYDFELTQRDPTRPYIITHEEFFQNEPEHEQTTLTYFESDDVLSDGRDQPVEDVNGTVGDDNVTRFGHGSKDNNIVYIRNERLELDFEIIRSQGKYSEEVLGFIEHSAGPKIRKFRHYD